MEVQSMISTSVIMVFSVSAWTVVSVPCVFKLSDCFNLVLVYFLNKNLLRSLAVIPYSLLINLEGFEKLVFMGGHNINQVADCLWCML